jgi:hypothetical protein
MTNGMPMGEKPRTIRKGAARRDPVSYQLEQDIVIPAGTILRSMGDGRFNAPIGATGQFTITVLPGAAVGGFKRVAAS